MLYCFGTNKEINFLSMFIPDDDLDEPAPPCRSLYHFHSSRAKQYI